MSPSNAAIRKAVRTALLTGAAAAIASPGYAADQTIQEVVVTGSRIAQPNLETTSPVTQVTSEDVITQGVSKIEDLVNQLPQAFAAQNGTISNAATGTATVNLRGLGSSRTLVLIDGRRMPYGGVTSASAAADLNQIPTAMVERVEILTGGASAVYGSDAVAGVVNFIMKKDFEGVQVDGQYSLYQHNNDFGGPGAVKLRDVIAGRAAQNPSQFALPDDNVTDGNGVQGTLTVGVSTEDGRGNLTAYVSYRDSHAVLERDRDYSACALGANPGVPSANGTPNPSFTCGGSGTAFPGTFTDFNGNNNSAAGPDGKRGTADDIPDTNPLPSFNSTVDQATGNFRPFVNATDQYNFAPTNFYLRPDTRYSLGVMGHYELASFADVYTQLMFSDIRSVAQIAPGGSFFNLGTINCDNPFLSAQQATTIGCGAAAQAAATTINPATITPANPTGSPFLADPNIVPLYIGRRNIEGGGRQAQFHNQSFRTLMGARGDIADGWNYDVSVQFSRGTVDVAGVNDFAVPNLQNALHAVRDSAGNIVCQSVIDGSDPNCVPYNPFAIGGVTAEALDYLQVAAVQSGVIDQNIVSAVVTGDLGTIGAKLPWADEPIKVAFGVENRRDKLENITDFILTGGLLGGSGGPTIGIKGSTNVNDVFMEASIPLVQGKPGVEQLSFDTAYRYSDYSSGITTDTYKFGLEYAPLEDVRFRASFQRAVRAPNIVELFTAQGFNLFDMDGDPCGAALAGKAGAAPDQACLDSGVPSSALRGAALDSPAGQYNFTQGGNTHLNPETSDTFSYGIVFTPRFAPGLSVSLDYFDIDVTDLISTFGAANSLDACYQFSDATACSRIHRNAQGQLWIGSGNVDDLNTNIGGLETSGVDLNLNYTGFDIGSLGSLNFNLTGTFLNELITDPGAAGFPPFDCTGLHAGACVSSLTTAANPEIRTRFRIGWETPWNVDVALTHRYISAISQEGAAPERIDRNFSHESYFDLFGSWNVSDMASLRLGINNVLDNDPQINASVGTTGNGNTYPQVYDALGRFIFGGVTMKF